MLRYKIDVLEMLNAAGYTTYRLRKDKLIGEANITRLRNSEMVGIHTIEVICRLLNIQPGNLLEYIKTENEQQKKTGGI